MDARHRRLHTIGWGLPQDESSAQCSQHTLQTSTCGCLPRINGATCFRSSEASARTSIAGFMPSRNRSPGKTSRARAAVCSLTRRMRLALRVLASSVAVVDTMSIDDAAFYLASVGHIDAAIELSERFE